MDTKRALIASLKYNSVWFIPVTFGLILVSIGLYQSVGKALIEAVEIFQEFSLGWIIQNNSEFTSRIIRNSSPVIGFSVAGFGYLGYRIMKTFLLFKTFGSALEKELESRNND